jgi:hypothetical protein
MLAQEKLDTTLKALYHDIMEPAYMMMAMLTMITMIHMAMLTMIMVLVMLMKKVLKPRETLYLNA